MVRLGEAHGGEGLRDLLLACHARIRKFARLAFTIGARTELPHDEVRAASAQCLRYFTEALPLHVRDEEDSLWPRLAGRSAAVDAALSQMRSQHFGHEAQLEALTGALLAVQAHPEDPSARRRLEQCAARLETDFAAHLTLEETNIFPHIDALSKKEQAQAVEELRARRRPRA
jgi:iron-sulfur cluster repair protein YtfE (RIC family)